MFLDKGSMQSSNLESFLDCTTPVIPSKLLPQNEIRNLNSLWHPWEREKVDYFTLGDLWNCYAEWSAYGAGVPITINDEENLVQYYVPYLSAIQVFTSSSYLNSFREEADSGGDCETRDSSSDWCSDQSESDRLCRWDGSSSDEGGFEQYSVISHFNNRLGHLYFQYFDNSSPYERVPLVDKMNGFARRYPGLMSLRNVDLSPASWMAVAWYPIYHIPMGKTIKDLSTSFLTYHTLSSSFQGMEPNDDDIDHCVTRKRKGSGCISLSPFALATYKMQGTVWGKGKNGRDKEKLASLLSVADSWLKQLRVQHHDFDYFIGIRRA